MYYFHPEIYIAIKFVAEEEVQDISTSRLHVAILVENKNTK
jgi:hypothetical protein